MSAASEGNVKAIVAGLKRSPLLASLTDRQLKRLATFAKVRDIAKDAVVVTKGEKGIGFYVVLEGQVQVRKDGKALASLGPGEFFGELALFDGRARSADVVTLEPTTVVVLSRWEFWGFAEDHPEVLRLLFEAMASRLLDPSRRPPWM
ncbi:MAG: cyclic nucleotide-binding domain-containing protein [Thermoplasmata archaeon]